MASAALKNTYSFVRYRIIALRYLGKAMRTARRLTDRRGTVAGRQTQEAAEVARTGFAHGPTLPADTVSAMREIYVPRGDAVVPRDRGHPFANLFTPTDVDADNPVFRHALSPDIMAIVHDYFDGDYQFETVQVLHSFPTSGPLRDSQKWHRDYGDAKSLHFITYLNDVEDDAGGPFGFVDRETTKRVRSSPIIRRIDDDRFREEIGPEGEIQKFYGKRGSTLIVDPANCYHFGSRCKTPRLAIFVTFNTLTPYEPLKSAFDNQREKVVAEAAKVRPDLDLAYLERIFGL